MSEDKGVIQIVADSIARHMEKEQLKMLKHMNRSVKATDLKTWNDVKHISSKDYKGFSLSTLGAKQDNSNINNG